MSPLTLSFPLSPVSLVLQVSLLCTLTPPSFPPQSRLSFGFSLIIVLFLLSTPIALLADAPLTKINSNVEECGRLCHSGPAELFDCEPTRHDSMSHLSPGSWKNVSFNSCFELRTQTTRWGSGDKYWQCGQLWISEGGSWRFEPLRKIMEGEPDQRGTKEENYQEATEIQHLG